MKDLIKYWLLNFLGKESYKKVVLLWWSIKNYLNRKFLFYESELKILPSVIKHGDCVIDVGLNMGQYTSSMQKLVGKKGTIIGFEPDPLSFEYAEKLVSSPNTSIYNFGLSDENISKNFAIFYDRFGNEILGLTAIVEDEIEFRSHLTHKVQIINIDCRKIDDFLNEVNNKISFIKCDVQGHELKVINGGINIIKSNKPTLLIEITIESNLVKLVNKLNPLGYKVYKYINRSLFSLEKISSSMIPSNNNYFFINRDSINDIIKQSNSSLKIIE